MTRINKMVMNGFKSFAKHTEILFNTNYNCVLGPNGSGKSNVLDALCFVLGKSSAKSMRAEKSANLIYNGGKNKKQSKQGEVSIYFDNSNKRFPTEDSEVKLTRVVRQNGQSIYKINDKVRTRQQIIDLLSVAKIDPDGYNIILQGDIVRFVEMRPEDRRGLIEEISGISVYEEKKQKAVRELERVDGKLKEAEIVLTEKNTYLRELKKDRDQALKFKDMGDQININKASLLKLQIDKKEVDRKGFKEKLDQGNNELGEINGKINEFKKGNEEKRNKIEEITKEIEEKGEVEQVKLNKEVEDLKIEITKKNSRIETLKNELIKIDQRKKDIGKAVEEIDEKLNELGKKKEEIGSQKTEQLNEKGIIEGKVKQFKEKNKLDNIGEIEKKTEELDKQGEELQKEIHSLRENQHNLIREKDGILHQINTIDEKINKVSQIEEEYKDELDGLKKKREEFKSSTLELNKRLNEDSSLAVQLGSARGKLQNASEELAKLSARQISIREMASGNVAVQKILARKGEMAGIHGTVSELGDVNSKYALALEVAAGPRIRSIVVEDDKVASSCIKYLKQNKLGTATFLPINKIKAKETFSEVKGLSDSKGCHGLATDLIEYDSKFKKIFSHVFANTLIVDNIDVARRLGIGKAKMVTVDGDVTEFSGVMQGGFRGKRKQGMGFNQKEVTNNINEYDGIVGEQEGVISTLEKTRKENEDKIVELRAQKANLEGEIIKTEKSLHLEAGDVNISIKQKDELKDKETKLEGQINEEQDKISEKNKELAAVKVEREKLKVVINQLRSPTLVAELNTYNEKLNLINEEVIKVDSELKNIDNQIDTIYNPEKEKTNEILKLIDKEAVQFKEELAGLVKSAEEQQTSLAGKEEMVKEFYLKFKGLFGKRGEIGDEIQKNETVINEKLGVSREIEIRNNTLSIKHAELSAILAGLNQEFEQYEGVKIDTEKTEEQLKGEVSKFEKLKNDIGSVNMRALEIYEDVEKEFNSLVERKDTLVSEKDDVTGMMDEIEDKKTSLFMKHFDVVNGNFGKIFETLSTKGSAHLELETPDNPFDGGLSVKVKITGNKFMDMRSLSGGEKTMTALAFIFAIQEHEPASFYILDEVDAALDKHNSERFAKLVGQYAEKAQYIVISHNDGVISQAENLYGVSMNEHNISQVVSLKV
ncbi:MAG: chromosome segregation protein SMC [Candidatus Woesearchaeota archaeon]|nr:chromosome segregation protein SMC [Candidatus Woesearchaeota archaeon]